MNKLIYIFLLFAYSCSDDNAETQYYPSGEKSVSIYKKKNDANVRFVYFFKNGKTQKILNEYNGIPNGRVEFFHENGAIAQKGYYKHGKLNGDYEFFHENGYLSEKVLFNSGKKVEDIFYYPNSQVKTHYRFDRDTLPISVEEFNEKGILTKLDVTPILNIDEYQCYRGGNLKVFYKLPFYNIKYKYKIHIGLTSEYKLGKQDFSDEKIFLIDGISQSQVSFEVTDSDRDVIFAFLEIRDIADTTKVFPSNFIQEKITIF